MAVWSVLELNVATISACLPTVRPLLQFLGHMFVTYSSSLSGSGKRSGAIDGSKKSYTSKNMLYPSPESDRPALLSQMSTSGHGLYGQGATKGDYIEMQE